MAIKSVNLLWTGRSGSDAIFTRKRTWREEYEVIVDSINDDESTTAQATGIPRIGQKHRKYPALVVSLESEQSDDSPFIWRVTVSYDSSPDLPNSTSPDGNNDPAQIPENPLLRPAVWKLSGNKTSEPVQFWRKLDNNGNLAAAFTLPTNSALLPFDPPLMAEVSRPVLRVTKNVPLISLEFLLRVQDAVNDRPWRNLPMWTARVDSYDATNKYENGVAFVELTLDIALKRETWMTAILDSGLLELTEREIPIAVAPFKKTVRKWTKIKDPFNHETDQPQPLDGKGRRLAPGADPVFLRGLPSNYHLDDFNTLMPF